MITNEQIGRFFRQECSREEAEEIGRYLEAHPERAQAFLEEEADDDAAPVSPERSSRIWKHISRRTQRGKAIKSLFTKAAAAASIVAAIGLGAYLLRDTNKAPGIIAAAPSVAHTLLENNSDTTLSSHLPDGTEVQLMPQSRIRFIKDFDADRRDVSLSGKARFAVAKDEKRPFTVFTDSISTTALGTEFEISAFAEDSKVYVHLIGGKVAVKHVAHTSATHATNVLTPGDRLVYNKTARSFTVSLARNKRTVPKLEDMAVAGETFIEGDNWYMFNNHALPEVLDELSRLYRKDIRYNRRQLKDMSFIGRLDGTDSLHKVLRSIALLNDLKLIKTNTGYILR